MSNALEIHRGKQENADRYWNAHYDELQPNFEIGFEEFKKDSYTGLDDKFDIVINGLGWVSVIGKLDECDIYHHPDTEMIIRKAMM